MCNMYAFKFVILWCDALDLSKNIVCALSYTLHAWITVSYATGGAQAGFLAFDTLYSSANALFSNFNLFPFIIWYHTYLKNLTRKS